jgi:hypothetical protein
MARDGLERQIALLHLFTGWLAGLTDNSSADSLDEPLRRRRTHVRDRRLLVALSLGLRP